MATVRNATAGEVPLFSDWARQEGWQPGVGDAAAFFAADPAGFHIGIEDGRVVAMVSVVRYDDDYAFLGHYIVAPDRRGEGLGLEVWNAGMSSVPGRVVGLDGVLEQVPNYEKSGFVTAHLTIRHAGDCSEIIDRLSSRDLATVIPVDSESDIFDEVAAFDARHVPAPRPDFVRAWLDPDSERCSFAVVEHGAVVGYATVRPAEPDGARIGPLFADDARIARSLLLACAEAAADVPATVCIDVPEVNEEAMALVAEAGMAAGFTCARMYRGDAPVLPLAAVFGNTTLELG